FFGCSAAQFDSGGIGRAALLAAGGGAASAIGGSDLEFPTTARNPMTEYYRLVYQDSTSAAGEAMGLSILPLVPLSGFDGVVRWTIMDQALLGDPELPTWTGPLRTLTVDRPAEAVAGDTAFEVTVLAGATPVGGARVCAWSPGHFLGVAITDYAGMAQVPI